MKDLFIVAHPDDAEVMLGHAIASAAEPHVVVVTSGEASTVDKIGDGFVKSGRRIKESQAGLTTLGVHTGNQTYLHLPDGQLADQTTELQEILGKIITDIKPDRIFTTGPTGYDNHPDHQAVHQCALVACQNIPVYALNKNNHGQLIIQGSSDLKLRAIGCHASQNFSADPNQFTDKTKSVYAPLLTKETYSTTQQLQT